MKDFNLEGKTAVITGASRGISVPVNTVSWFPASACWSIM